MKGKIDKITSESKDFHIRIAEKSSSKSFRVMVGEKPTNCFAQPKSLHDLSKSLHDLSKSLHDLLADIDACVNQFNCFTE